MHTSGEECSRWEICKGPANNLDIQGAEKAAAFWLEVVSLGAGQGSGGASRPSQNVKGIRRLRKGLWIFVPRNALETSEEFQQGNDKPGQGFQGPQITWLILKTT